MVVGYIAVVSLWVWWQQGALRWFFTGVSAANLPWLIYLVVDRLDGSRSWRDGVFGEELTAEALQKLEQSGWKVFHGLEFQTTFTSNVDHTVIGPGGMFAVETKSTKGVWTASKSRKWLGGAAAQARWGADRIEKLLYRRVSKGSVRPVVVVWGELDKNEPLPETVEGVPIMHGRDLANWLTGQATLLDSSTVEELSEAVRGFANRQQAASTSV
jgi:hypothetical protein